VVHYHAEPQAHVRLRQEFLSPRGLAAPCQKACEGPHVGGFEIAVQDAAPVCRIESAGDLKRQRHGFFYGHGPLQRGSIDKLEDQIIRADVEDLADMRMAERGKGVGFLLKSRGAGILEALEGDDAIKTRVAGLPHLTHGACTDQRKNFIRTETVSRS
jgi:hypothetical protein